ncbi:hypothetical protein M422DRAFT_240705 [Sphaerobolus stellatus SS14]|nr:hypothetical protein M422DRAFT_240705 [Sphaerobolus stellatus SS14]
MFEFTTEEWDTLKHIQHVLAEPATAQAVFSNFANDESFSELWPAIEAAIKVLKKYYNKADQTTVNIVCLMLNPAIKLEYIKVHWEKEWFDKYYIPPTEKEATEPAVSSGSPVKIGSSYGSAWITLAVQQSLAAQCQSSDPCGELAQYVNSPLALKEDNTVAWWGYHSMEYPTLARIVWDYLAIQGSSVPCKHCFSSSGLTGTNHCNCLLPKTFEALQILKNAYKTGNVMTVAEVLAAECCTRKMTTLGFEPRTFP